MLWPVACSSIPSIPTSSRTAQSGDAAAPFCGNAGATIGSLCADGALLRRLSEGLNELDLAVLLLDGDLRPRFANQALITLFGLDAPAAPPRDFRAMLEHAVAQEWPNVGRPGLPQFLDEQEALIQGGAATPVILDLGLKGQALFKCVPCRTGDRLLTYACQTATSEFDAAAAIEQITAEMRFRSELMEEQGAHLAELAETAELNAQRLNDARLRLEHELTERRALEKQLRRLAVTDALTGVLNRAGLLARAQNRLEKYRQARRQLAVLMLDADHFKAINDQWGHEGGDCALQGLADVLRAGLRRGDLVGRLGGEEFAVVLGETDPPGAVAVAERLRRDVAATRICHAGQVIPLTVSIGVAMQHDADRQIAQVIRRADSAMYRAKASGRNRALLAAQADPA